MQEKTVIISLGGSLIVPEEIDWEFVKKFKALIEEQIANGFKLILIATLTTMKNHRS
jgi:uridylate kinase